MECFVKGSEPTGYDGEGGAGAAPARPAAENEE